MTKLIRIDRDNPDKNGINRAVEMLRDDAVVIYPSDSVYTMGCRIYSQKAFTRLCKIKEIPENKAQFSIVCSDYSHLSEFTKQLDNHQFRTLKTYLPGPYTFIMEGNKMASKIFQHEKKTIGFRIPNMTLVEKLIKELDEPLFSASIQLNVDSPYATTAEELLDKYQGQVDLIIDGGLCGEVPTTIVDISTTPYQILRQGAGEFNEV